MQKNIKHIIDNIYSEKINNVRNLEISIEDFLWKDENNVTLIEHILKNNIEISYAQENLFRSNPYIAYLYCKYDKNIFFFYLDEKALFTTINNELLIVTLLKTDKVYEKFIKAINTKLEIVDLIIEHTKYNFYLEYLSQDIIQKLMEKNNNDEYIIEKYFNDEKIIKYIIPLIKNNPNIINICKNHDKENLLEIVNENILMYNINNDFTLLDELLEKGIIPDKLNNIPNNLDYINFLREKNLYKYLKNAKEEILLLEVNKGKTLLEELIDKGYNPELNSIYNKETIKILYKLNKLDLATNISERLLITPIKGFFNDYIFDNKLLIDYMLDEGYNPIKNSYNITEKEIIKILYNRKNYTLLADKISGENILLNIDENHTILDILLQHNLTIKITYSEQMSLDIAQKIYNYKRFDILTQFNLEVLMTHINDNNTFMDYILEEIKEKRIRFNLNSINTFSTDLETLANFYLCVAKHDMIYYLDEFKEEQLLHSENNNSLLEELLKINPELTLSKILTKKLKSNPKIALLIKSKRLEQSDIDIIENKELYSEDYLNKFYNTLGIGPLLYEGQILLDKLFELFSNDGKSDPMIIHSLINGYRQSLLQDYNNTVNEIKNLIKIKEKYPQEFFYNKTNDGAYFSSLHKSIFCDIPTVNTILHETGHAQHHFLTSFETPKQYKEIIEKIRNNPNTIKFVENFANNYSDEFNNIKQIAEQKWNNYFNTNFPQEKLTEIESSLVAIKETKKKEYEHLNISKEELYNLIDENFTMETYLDHIKRTFINQYTDSILRSEHGSLIAISDILDAIYEGEFHNGLLKNKNGKLIKSAAGHGIAYYYEIKNGFNEMIANFATIVKAHDAPEMLNLLKNIVGDELYNLLNDFYYNNFILDNNHLNETTISPWKL